MSVNSSPDEFTFSTLAKISGEITGKWVHGKCVKLGLLIDTVLVNSIMSMYCKCDRIQEARQLFDEMPERIVSSWNIMLATYVSTENPFSDSEVWGFVKNMLTEGRKPNGFTLCSLIPLCGNRTGPFDHGRELHCYIIRKMDLDADSGIHLNCCLIDMYSRRGKISSARHVFDQMRFENVFAWTAMMNGYLQIGDHEETVNLFCEMRRTSKVEPNEVSVLTLLPACSLTAGLLGVQQVHGLSVKTGFLNHTCLCNCLIDMYSKHGLLTSARKLFDHDCWSKNAISYGCIITGCGLHGAGQEAVNLYAKMVKNGIKPDAVSVVGVLSACSKSGLVEKGLDVYNKAVSVYGVEPTVEMCSCVVDLLGRSGQLDEGLRFIKSMGLKPEPSVWGALVSGCVVDVNYETKVLGYKSLIEIEPENASNYVSLSNVYASSGKWDCVGDIRRVMKERRLRKVAGCSWIIVNSKTHSFLVADKAHPACDKIYEILNELILVMKRP
ncbi:pentatricopeptide repeat-containing protein At3g57430, chloroplastic-like [Bidens hawaiensis]|uniref:pentatricopeptide repeat-containing protein At3g57430, chloroplastic-like n=1 Tax=Bidens hawaiensis TaxID=980011 RepID=UPI00404A34B0